MEYMITTFAHGNGPYSRTIDLGLAINEQLKTKKQGAFFPLIVPLVYGERQKRIMIEEYGDFIKNKPDAILLDDFYGKILNELFFKAGHYQENLELLLEKQPALEEKLRDYLAGTLTTKTFDGTEVKINGKDIAFEISHNPRVATGYERSYYTTIAYFSEILEKTALESSLDFDPKILNEVKEKISKKIEKDKKIHFIPEPFVFSYDLSRTKQEDEIFTPPFIHMPKRNNEKIQKGMYIMVTGIDGLKGLFDGIHQFGMKLYCPPFIDIEGADKSRRPEFIANPNIEFQFGRTGWSTVWWSHMTETPLITPAYTKGDDPEIYFNEKTVKKLGLAVIFDKSKNSKKILKEAKSLKKNLKKTNKKITQNYGTLDGIDYTAKIITEHLQGKDISKYKKVQPALC